VVGAGDGLDDGQAQAQPVAAAGAVLGTQAIVTGQNPGPAGMAAGPQ
jgi:hypothetical protein